MPSSTFPSKGKLIALALESLDGPICMHIEIKKSCLDCVDFMKKNYPGLVRYLR